MPDHTVQRLDGVGCIDDFADVCRVSEERRQVSQVCLPAPAYLRIAAVPGTVERFQRLQTCFFSGGLVDGFPVVGDCLIVLLGHETKAVAHHMHYTSLDTCLRIHSVDGVREYFQAVNTGDEDIFQTTVFQLRQHVKP